MEQAARDNENLIERAARIAVQAHIHQQRKTDESPYVVHPFMVAMLLREFGFPDTYIAAALVHDVVEDTPVSLDDIRDELGDDVAALVSIVSEDKTLPWEDRKAAYVEAVRKGPEGAKAIFAADRIHNAESLLYAHSEHGDSVWTFFNRGRDAKVHFEQKALAMLQETWHHPLVEQYAKLVARIEKLS